MLEDRVYMAGAEDELGDQHLFASESPERAAEAYREFQERFGKAMRNDGLADFMDKRQSH